MPKTYLFFAALFLSFSAFSQNNVSISGKILDSQTQLPLEAATVYLTSVADSTMIDYTITDKNGAFTINLKKINKPVYLKVSYIGYHDFKQKVDAITETKNFGTLRLEVNENTLKEIVIKNEAPPVRVKNDTLEFNASSFKLRPDANVEALLKQLPGVEIDTEGKITVNGKEVNQILVNGKPFFDKDGKVALQNLPSELINKVQVSDTKTKKEEISGTKASSNEASINLTIDEEKNKGFFGKATVGVGSDKRYESSLMGNYFKGKRKISLIGSANNINSTGFSMNEIFDSMGGGRNYSIYTNDDGSFGINNMRFGGGSGITESQLLGLNYADEWFKGFDPNASYFYTAADTKNTNRTKQVNFVNDQNFTTLSNAKTRDHKYAHNFNMNVEYKIDSTATLYLNPKFVKGHSEYTNRSDEFSQDDDNGRLMNENTRYNFDETDNQNFGNNAYFFKSFKKKGRSVSAWFNNENNKEQTSNLNRSEYTFYDDLDHDGVTDATTEDNRNQIRYNRNIKDNYGFGLEYTEPVRDSLNVKVGFDFANNRLSNERKAFDFDPATGKYTTPNDVLSNYLLSSTNSVSPYTGISIEKKKYNIGITLGTAITNFNNESFYLGNRTTIHQNYMLPTGDVYGNYNFTKSKNIWASYGYHVDFPTGSQVLPVSDFSDPLNTIIGNSALEPIKYHNLYVSFRDYDYATKSGYSLYGGGNYNESQVVTSVTIDDSAKRITQYVNVSDAYNTWFGGNWNKAVKKEANSYKYGLGLNAGYNKIKGFTNGELYTAMQVRLNPRVNFTYDYGELLSITPSYNYSYNVTNYSNARDKESSNVHKFNLQTTNYWPKHFVFGNDFGYTYNSNIADGFKKDFYLWNMSLGYNFLGDKLLAKVKVYDMLNQNQNTSRTITANYIRDEENVVLKRYVMFSVMYKLDKFAGKKDALKP